MDSDRITLIISDLHVGGGQLDKGDDHVFHKNQLVNFLNSQAQTAEGLAGRLELFINGDFLEFAQTDIEAFSHLSDGAWCTELESLRKLDTIIAGHIDIFSALADFQKSGNWVTIAAGNHDVDLYWPKVQARIQQVAGAAVRFEIGQTWVERYGGALQIAHGHMNDDANKFKNWKRPIVSVDFGVERLEMCPGTLFMVKFVNKLEAEYPFADNLLPVTKLASVLWSDEKSGFAALAWMFMRFVTTTSPTVLDAKSESDFGKRLLNSFHSNLARSDLLASVLTASGMSLQALEVTEGKLTEKSLASLMFALLGRIDLKTWQGLFELSPTGTTLGAEPLTLSAIHRASKTDGKQELQKVAAAQRDLKRASVVVMGHTHQADHVQWADSQYFNPGSWTRYLELKPGQKVTLEDLRDEAKYPYALNVVRVEPRPKGLSATMICIDKSTP